MQKLQRTFVMCFQRFSHGQKDRKHADKQKTERHIQTIGQINRQEKRQTEARGDTQNRGDCVNYPNMMPNFKQRAT